MATTAVTPTTNTITALGAGSGVDVKALAQSLSVELKSFGVSVCISYVGFTENESDKKTLAPNGDWVKVPSRNKQLTVTRTSTANKILNQIENKKYLQKLSNFNLI